MVPKRLLDCSSAVLGLYLFAYPLSGRLRGDDGVPRMSRRTTRITFYAVLNIKDWLHFGPVQSTRQPP
jgi:hypothetical protein